MTTAGIAVDEARPAGWVTCKMVDRERHHYLGAGRLLEFGDDVMLPADPADYLEPLPTGGWRVRAPSGRVPWDADERGFFPRARSIASC